MDAAPPIDPESTTLTIGTTGIVPSDQDGWRALGECIGCHEYLQELIINGVNTTRENLEALLTGVNQNISVEKLQIIDCDGEWPLGVLATFFQRNQYLSSLKVVDSCHRDIVSSLSAALRGCRSLQKIIYWDSQMGDNENTAEFIEALAGLPQLTELLLDGSNISPRGCDAVAALLQRPACVLQTIYLDNSGINDENLAVLAHAVAESSTLTELSLCGMDCSTTALQSFSRILRSQTCVLKILYLHGNTIGDDAIVSFSDALATNHRLEELRIDDDHTISDIGFAAMTRALCNTSSIGDVHSSNHTLQYLYLHEMPNDLRNYLCMNKREDKSQVVREKIFMHFFKGDFSMEPFHENNLPPNILPHLVSWIGRTSNGESFTALFNFLRRMPPVWGDRHPVLRRSRRKRKVRN